MACAFLLSQLCVWLLILGLGHGDVQKFTEKEFDAAELSALRLFILPDPAPLTEEHISSLEAWLRNTTAAVVQVSCSSVGSELCTLLSTHTAVIRDDKGALNGVELQEGTPVEAFITKAMESLLGQSISLLTSNEVHQKFLKDDSPRIFAVVFDSDSQEYQTLLSSCLAFPSLPHPLIISNRPEAVPLTHRPKHSSSSQPMHVWYMTDRLWLPFFILQHRPPKRRGSEGRGKEGLRERMLDFIRRTHFPVIVEYTGPESTTALKDSGVWQVYTFYPPGEQEDLASVIRGLAKRVFSSFAFIMIDREKYSDLATKLYVPPTPVQPHMIIMPQEESQVPQHISPEHIEFSVDVLSHSLPYLIEHIHKQALGDSDSDENDVQLTLHRCSPSEAQELAQEGWTVLAAFCEKDSKDCPRYHGKLEKTMSTVQHVVHSLEEQWKEDGIEGKVAALVVECSSVEEVQKVKEFSITTLPAVRLFSPDDGWTLAKPDSSAAEIANFIVQTNSFRIKTSDEMRHQPQSEYHQEYEPDEESHDQSHDHVSEPDKRAEERRVRADDPFHRFNPLKEDDHFGQLARTLPPADPPSELHLTDKTLDDHVTKYDITLVAFYMKWDVRSRVFLHHFMAAVDALDPALNTSLALVSCSSYTDVCARFAITSYPIVKLFHGCTSAISDYNGVLDARHLLQALGQELRPQASENVPELRPDTLPLLLSGELHSTLVLGCGRLESEGVGLLRGVVNNPEYKHLKFAWMDSSRHPGVLKKLVGETTLQSVLVMDFEKRNVYQLTPPQGLPDSFEAELQKFLSQYVKGALKPTASFQPKLWTPLQAPIYFPYPKSGSQDKSEFDDDFDFFDDDQLEEPSPYDQLEETHLDGHETGPSPKHTEL